MTELKTKTIQKQIVIQSQDLQMVTDNIGRMISNAEILVFLNNKNNKAFPPKGFKFRFNFFKYRNINEWNINDLRRALCQKINLTKMSFNDYIKEYCNNDSNRFNYDKNFGKKEMLDYIDYLTEFVCDYDKQILMEIKNIFEPKRSNNFDKIYNDTKKIKSNIPFNLRDVCHYGPGLSYYNECRKNIATKKALDEGKVTSSFPIDKENYEDEDMLNFKEYSENERNRILYNESLK